MVAFAAIAELHRRHGDRLRVAIVVPTMQLARQWRDGLTQHLFLPRHLVGEQHSTADVSWTPDHPILATVINTARSQLKKVAAHWAREGTFTLLIVDECHRAGAESNARIFDSSFGATLGLSATPDRDDDGDHTYVYPNLGRPVYSYPLLRALDDEVLAPLRSVNLYVDFTAEERKKWDATAEALTMAMRSLRWEHPDLNFDSPDIFARIGRLAEMEDPAALRVVALLSSRRELLSDSEGRRDCIAALFDWLTTTNRKTIAFHETIAGAQRSLTQLEDRRVRAVLDHSQMKPKDRQQSLAEFARPTTQVLVAVRSLDEGLDVPDADVAMILAGSRSKRQRIQRIGRVVRPKAGKQALAVTILIRNTPEETVTGARDSALLGTTRVEHHRWPDTTVDNALAGVESSYRPAGDGLRLEVDRITLRWVNRSTSR
jgi:superfamily II DNA or RNA helicase